MGAQAAGLGPVDPEAQREYDGFGPWMLPVRQLEDMPQRFRTCYPEHAQAPFLLKLPRPEERRNLAPGMDLYLAVLAVHETEVVLMRQEGTGLQVLRCPCAAIQAIRVFQHLLHGRLELLTADGTRFGLDYNGSSQEVIDQVVGFLRQRLPGPGERGRAVVQEQVPVPDFCFQTALAEQRRLQPECRVLHAEPMGRGCRDLLLRRALYLGLLVLGTPRELILVTQGKLARRSSREGALASEVLYVPWASLDGFQLLPTPARRGGWQTLRLQVGRHLWDVALFEPEKLMRLLGRMGFPAR